MYFALYFPFYRVLSSGSIFCLSLVGKSIIMSCSYSICLSLHHYHVVLLLYICVPLSSCHILFYLLFLLHHHNDHASSLQSYLFSYAKYEHSSVPVCFQSQQDLSLFDDEPEHDAHNARNLRKMNHPKPPAAQTNLPENGVRNAPFLASEKSASHNVDPDTLEIFQRFGITFGGKHEEEVPDVACGQVVDEDSDILSEEDSDQDTLQLSPSKQRLIQPHTTQQHLIQPHTTQQHLIQPHTTQQHLIQPHTAQQRLIQPHTTRDDALVPATDEPRPVSPAEAASYSRDMQGYQNYFTEAYNESSHQSAVTEQPKPSSTSPVPQLDLPKARPEPQSSVTLTNNPKADPKTSSTVTVLKNPKTESETQSPATPLKDPEPQPEPQPEPHSPKQPSDTLVSLSVCVIIFH